MRRAHSRTVYYYTTNRPHGLSVEPCISIETRMTFQGWISKSESTTAVIQNFHLCQMTLLVLWHLVNLPHFSHGRYWYYQHGDIAQMADASHSPSNIPAWILRKFNEGLELSIWLTWARYLIRIFQDPLWLTSKLAKGGLIANYEQTLIQNMNYPMIGFRGQ